MVMQACYPSTLQAEIGRPQRVRGQPSLACRVTWRPVWTTKLDRFKN